MYTGSVNHYYITLTHILETIVSRVDSFTQCIEILEESEKPVFQNFTCNQILPADELDGICDLSKFILE